MTVPRFKKLMIPILVHAAAKSGETYIAELEEQIAQSIGLNEDDRSQVLPSGQQTVFSNRLNWAKSYMGKAGLIESTRRGFFCVTDSGRALLAEGVAEIDNSILMRFPSFVAWRAQQKPDIADGEMIESSPDVNPEEQIALSFDRLTKELSAELIERVHNFTPVFFERLIVDLLLSMGYGGGRAEMGRALGRSGDGGIDGVIKEDELGLDVVYVQAKRYSPENAVPVREVRDFIGSLEGHRATKGVFVTTSYFPESARDFVGRVSKRVILIDGKELSRLMIRHRVGVRVKDVYEIKKIDEDYFVE